GNSVKRITAVLIAVAVTVTAISCSSDGITDFEPEETALPRVIASYEQFTSGRFAAQPFEDMAAEFATELPEPDGRASWCSYDPESDEEQVCEEYDYIAEPRTIQASWQAEVISFTAHEGQLPLAQY